MPYKPCEMVVSMKLVETENAAYYIGNCDMHVDLKDTVITLIEPKEGTRETVLMIKNENKQRRKMRAMERNGQHQPQEYDDDDDSTSG